MITFKSPEDLQKLSAHDPAYPDADWVNGKLREVIEAHLDP